ncbi:MAG: hypothetical protein Q9182_004127 [Xanthomendoza sp. 2 TL-2023]
MHVQVLQTLFGLGVSLLGDGEPEVTGSEDRDVAIWIERVHHGLAALPSLLALTGVDFKAMAMTLSGPGALLPVTVYPQKFLLAFEVLLAKALYCYGLGCALAGLTTRMSIILFGYGTFKNVFDHCGYQFPWNPISWITGTDPDFHDVHHQSWGLKANFGAHLSIWDHMMGTYFADQQQISRLRMRNRVVAKEPVLVETINTVAGDLASSSALEGLHGSSEGVST